MSKQKEDTDEKPKRKPRREGWIDWLRSESKKIVMMDLYDDVLPLDEKKLPTDHAWEINRHQPEFVKEKVPYEQFEKNLESNQEQVAKKKAESARQLQAFEHDLEFYPPKPYKANGKPAFHLHPAHKKLHKDIENDRHKTMTRSELKQSRPEYPCWETKEFSNLVHQVVRAQKFNLYVIKEAKKRKPKRASDHDGRRMLIADAVASLMDDS